LHRSLLLPEEIGEELEQGLEVRVFAQGIELIPLEVRITQLEKTKHETDPNEECNLYGEPCIAANLSDYAVDHIGMAQDKPGKLEQRVSVLYRQASCRVQHAFLRPFSQ
jgi:hypothetical protein